MIREAEVYILAEQALTDVFAHISADQWDQRKPAWFQTGGQGNATLREVVNHHAFDTAWVPDVLAGRTVQDVGTAWDTLKQDGAARYAELAQTAIAAARGVEDGAREVHLSYGEYPAAEYLKHITSFRGFRVYDVAKWIGSPAKMSDELVEGMWELIVPDIEEWRAMGVFPAAVPVPEDAPLQDRLLGLSGRDPYASL